MTKRTILLNPGPVTLTEGVRGALLRPDMCHREASYAAIALDVKRRLGAVYPAATKDHEAIMLTGSGTLAVESMLASLLPDGSRSLLVVNGVYGERMAAMLEAHGKSFRPLIVDWLEGLPLESVDRILTEERDVTHVLAVHNETTTGRLNDVAGLGALCHKHERALLLDTVSSFGAEWIDFQAWNLEAVAATSNKCLHGVPGVAFVVARRDIFSKRKSAARSIYLDLFRYQREQQTGFSPFTPAVQSCLALQVALEELESAGGWEARRQVYESRSHAVRDRLAALGVETLLKEPCYSSMITSFQLPAGRTYAEIHDRLLDAGFIIYAGQGPLSTRCFRIATMGEIGPDDLHRLLESLSTTFGGER